MAATSRPPETAAGRMGRWSLTGIAVLGFVYLFIPIAVIIAYSFNKPRGKFNIIWREFTFDNWRDPLAPGPLTDAMVLSLKIAAISAMAATVLGSLIALALVRYRFKGGALVNLLLVLPLTTPEIVLGSSLATLFIDRGVQRGFWTIVIGHATFCVVVVYNNVLARFRRSGRLHIEASMDLGADGFQTFRYVVLPNIATALLAGGMLAFALSFDEVIVTTFTAGQQSTLPIWIFSQLTRPRDRPVTNVVAFLVVSIMAVPILLAHYLSQDSRGE